MKPGFFPAETEGACLETLAASVPFLYNSRFPLHIEQKLKLLISFHLIPPKIFLYFRHHQYHYESLETLWYKKNKIKK